MARLKIFQWIGHRHHRLIFLLEKIRIQQGRLFIAEGLRFFPITPCVLVGLAPGLIQG